MDAITVFSAWRYGLRLGVRCISCCANLTLILLVVGVMDFRTMLIVTLAITVERLARDYRTAARAIGIVTIAVGLHMLANAMLASAT